QLLESVGARIFFWHGVRCHASSSINPVVSALCAGSDAIGPLAIYRIGLIGSSFRVKLCVFDSPPEMQGGCDAPCPPPVSGQMRLNDGTAVMENDGDKKARRSAYAQRMARLITIHRMRQSSQ